MKIDLGKTIGIMLLISFLFTWETALSVAQDADVAEVTESVAQAQEEEEAEFVMVEHPLAIIPFKTRGKEVEGMGDKVSDLMFAQLVVDPALFLVDREDLGKVLGETELNLSGLVSSAEAIEVGKLTGAKLLVTGSVFEVEEKIYLVAKIIGTETTRVVGASVKSDDDESLDELVAKLGKEVIASIKKNSSRLVATKKDLSSRIASIREQLGDGELPSVYVSIDEEHVGRNTLDPAAQTEMMMILKECGFDVLDSDRANEKKADFLVKGEGVSEFATRTGNLISAKARLEIKVIQRSTDRVVAVDRQTKLAVDLGEQIAGKQALQNAAADIAERIIPKIVK